MNPIVKIIGWLAFLTCTSCFVHAQEGGNEAQQALDVAVQDAQVIQRSYSFKQLGINGSVTLQGSGSELYVGFGSRLDEVITAAEVNINLIPSPSLIAQVSHVRVFLNNELMGVVTINDDNPGKTINTTVALDPRFISNYNQVHFELIGAVDNVCSDPNDPSLWGEISSASKINLTIMKTEIDNELSLFPAPFFDERDLGAFSLPLIIPKGFQLEALQATGILASHFAALADWREQAFPVYHTLLSEQHDIQQHAIVFATNAHKPEFIKNLPEITKPAVQIIAHPRNSKIKLLLVLGKDAQQLNQAVRGLVLGNRSMSGEMAEIINYQSLSKRQPYDAPHWLDTSKAVAFSELIENKFQLQTVGVQPAPVNLNFKLPPDLFTWQSNGVLLDLKFRYSPVPNDASGAKLTLLVNHLYLQSVTMDGSGLSRSVDLGRIPLIGQDLIASGTGVEVPGFRVDQDNNFSFDFSFILPTQGACIGREPRINYALIDEDSSLDFSSFPHYIEMPNLSSFANTGYPFSRLADLSETLIVMAREPSDKEIELFIHIMTMMGKQTGLAAYNVELVSDLSAQNATNKDLLVIAKEGEALFDNTVQPMLVNAFSESAQDILRPLKAVADSRISSDSAGEAQVGDILVKSRGEFAAIMGFESPFTSNRSVVVMSAAHRDDFQLLKESLSAQKIANIFGSIVTVRSDNIDSYRMGETYFVGKLPIHQLLWFHFSDSPFLIALLAILLVVIISVLIWRTLRAISHRRLALEDDEL